TMPTVARMGPQKAQKPSSFSSTSWGSGAVSGGRSASSWGGGGGCSTCGCGTDWGSCCGGVGSLSLSGGGLKATQPTFSNAISTQACTSAPVSCTVPEGLYFSG